MSDPSQTDLGSSKSSLRIWNAARETFAEFRILSKAEQEKQLDDLHDVLAPWIEAACRKTLVTHLAVAPFAAFQSFMFGLTSIRKDLPPHPREFEVWADCMGLLACTDTSQLEVMCTDAGIDFDCELAGRFNNMSLGGRTAWVLRTFGEDLDHPKLTKRGLCEDILRGQLNRTDFDIGTRRRALESLLRRHILPELRDYVLGRD